MTTDDNPHRFVASLWPKHDTATDTTALCSLFDVLPPVIDEPRTEVSATVPA
jgi:hypothetical protein